MEPLPVRLECKRVTEAGGQGTSRGGADIKEIVKRIKLWGVSQLYVVGGNGGNAAANAIDKECTQQGVLCSVVGVPKSIDNDILLVRYISIPPPLFPTSAHADERSAVCGGDPPLVVAELRPSPRPTHSNARPL